MINNLKRGFTLIELLVVIAIIGILAAVVLASLNDARSSGSDASAKGSMTSVRNQAELYYNGHGFSYQDTGANPASERNVCTSVDVAALTAAAAAAGAGAGNCNDSATAYAADVQLNGGGHFCVDSTGFAGNRANALGTSATVCPTS